MHDGTTELTTHCYQATQVNHTTLIGYLLLILVQSSASPWTRVITKISYSYCHITITLSHFSTADYL